MTYNHKKKSLDDIIFENKNKEYGAYELRKSGKKYLTIAFFIGFLFFLTLISSIFIYLKLKDDTPPPVKYKEEIVAVLPPTPEKVPEEIPEKVPEEKIYTIEDNNKGSERSTVEKTPKQDEVAQKKYFETKVDNSKEEQTTPKQSELVGKNIGEEDKEGKITRDDDINRFGKKNDGSSHADDIKGDPNSIVKNPQKKAKFNGGDWGSFLRKILVYPSKAEFNETQGTVMVQFVVDKKGNISDLKIISKRLGNGLEEEAMRVLKKSSGLWSPGEINGEPVNSYYTQSITFQLE
ncbi:energy transducer TonB [Apibacter muscae]|uniref:Energy transducer TonB n=1 Tax=Apibacter muscae TaxID=2509004 RepID=A0A563D8A7_9FLAO|nr:energy transducer TonB [Apibacter muscae]TWP26044.1 energy transducer TonB [Apibacter muscae]